MFPGLLEIGCDDDAFAGGEAVHLDDVRRAEVVQGVVDRSWRRADVRAGGRDVGGRHDLLGEGLAALELGGRGGRAEDEETALVESWTPRFP